jgi:hypothetical protein
LAAAPARGRKNSASLASVASASQVLGSSGSGQVMKRSNWNSSASVPLNGSNIRSRPPSARASCLRETTRTAGRISLATVQSAQPIHAGLIAAGAP